MAHKTDIRMLGAILQLMMTQIIALEVISPLSIKGSYYHVESHFGPSATNVPQFDSAHNVVLAAPDLDGCSALSPARIAGNVVLILRGSHLTYDDPDYQCKFSTKVLYAQRAGAVAAIIGNDFGDVEIIPMNEDNPDVDAQITIPSISVSRSTFEILYKQIKQNHSVAVKINDKGQIDDIQYNKAIERWITAVLSTLMLLSSISLVIAGVLSFNIFMERMKKLWAARQRRLRVDGIPTIHYSDKLIINHPCEEQEDQHSELIEAPLIGNTNTENKSSVVLHNETCNVCLEDFMEGEKIRVLRCKHGFHDKCIKSWIVNKGKCPVCRDKPFWNTDEDTDSTNNLMESLYV
eukprot:542699_1